MKYSFKPSPDDKTLIVETDKPALYTIQSIGGVQVVTAIGANLYQISLGNVTPSDAVRWIASALRAA